MCSFDSILRYLVLLVLLTDQAIGQEAQSQPPLPPPIQTQPPPTQTQQSILYSNEVSQVVQDSMACFAVTTAAKIMKSKDMEEDKNIFFSPLDLYTATALTYIGSDGEARRRLGNILGIKEPRPNVHSRRRRQQPRTLEDIYRTIGALVNQSRDSNLAAIQYGAGVYVYNDFAIKSTYIEDARNYFGIEVKCTDFKLQNVASTELINNDIAKATNQRIAKFFLEPVSPETQLVVPSTLSFVGKWQNLFNPDDTYETAFRTREDGCDDSYICLMMNLQTIPYFKDHENNLEAIGIPFNDPNLFMYFVVPTKIVHLKHVIENPNKNILLKIVESAQPQKVRYHVPKMALEAHVDEMQLFKQTGISNLTQNEIADCLSLTNLEQVVEIELNEEGVGGCLVDESKKSPSVQNVNDPSAVEFIVDKPYIFFVYHKLAKTFLFYGVIFKPLGYEN